MLNHFWQMISRHRSAGLFALALLGMFAVALAGEPAQAQSAQPGAAAAPAVPLPGSARGYDSDFWRAIRQGTQGTVSIPDKKAGVLVQSEGDNWRALRNGPLSLYGAWALIGVIALLGVYFTVRGRIKIDKGWSKRTIIRFNMLERAGHWLLAVSFIILGITGLNVLYGRYVLKPLIGPEAFANLASLGKLAHNYVGFAFMAGLIWVFVAWIKDNFPNRHDAVWIIQAGGMLMPGVHPPAKKFNAGQKILFWLILLGGLSLSLSGLALMFPFEFTFFTDTVRVLSAMGINGLPSEFTPMQEMQLNQLWHAAVAIVLIAIVIAHIYIGSIGMQGAFAAMGSGEVDENWAKEHHPLWVEKIKEQKAKERRGAAAE